METFNKQLNGQPIILEGDAIQIMQNIEKESIDLIIADPPYFQIKGDFDFIWSSQKEYLEWSAKWLNEAHQILKPTGSLILWGGVGPKPLTFARLAIMIEDEQKFKIQNWITQRNTRGYGTSKNYMSAREDFLFLTKTQNYTFNVPYMDEKSNRKDLGFDGKPRKNTHKRVSNVWYDIAEASQSSIERCNHPTVKAQKLCDRIIKTHSNEGDLIYIPFAGSGSEIISAINNNRMVVASEINPEYIKLAYQRIEKLMKKNNHLIK